MKKGLSLFFSLIFAVGICLSASFVVEANAASTSDLTFKLSEDGTGYEITDCKKTASGTLTIPDTYNGKPVVGIAGDAFTDCSSISVLKLSKNIEYSNDGFWGCSFKEVYIPDLKKWCSIELGTEAGIPLTPLRYAEKIFVNGKLFTELNISPSDNITTINKFAFHCAKNLKKVNISGSVTKIDDFAFTYCPELATVVIGDSLEELGGGAFYDCAKLTSVKLPNKPLNIGHSYIGQEMGIKSVFSSTPIESAAYNSGEQCFYVDNHMISIFPDKSNGSLKIKEGTLDIPKLDFLYSDYGMDIISSVEIPGSVKVIPENAFYNLPSLEEIYLGYGIKEIGELAFARTGIYSVEIPSSVESIGEAAFYNCKNMDEVRIPSSVKFIDEDAFGFTNDGEITGFTIFGETGSAAEEYADENGFDFIATNKKVSINDLEFTLNSDGKSYSVTGYDEDITGALVIPSTYNGKPVTSVCSLGGAYVSSIVIPDSVTSWPGAPEGGYSCLETVTVGNGLTSCPSFFGSVVKVVNLGTGIKNFSIRAFDWCGNLKEINIASGNPNYTSVDGVVFNKNKTTLLGYPQAKYSYTYTIPSTVTKIAETAFLEAHEIYNVKIPGSVKIIEESAFNTCPNLQSVVITSGTTTIGEYAFYDCQKLNSITIPASVTSIGKYAFGYLCLVTDTSPGELIKNDGFTIYGAAGSAAETYANNNGFKFVDVNARDFEFELNSDGKSYSIVDCDENVTGELVIPGEYKGKPVTVIAGDAIDFCEKITSVIIPDSVTKIDCLAFESCYALKTVKLGKNVKTIGECAFEDCSSLVSISIPSGLKIIEDAAFNGCDSMKSIEIPESVTSIGECAIGYTNKFKGIEGFTIYGASGSAAETYANNNGFKFIASIQSAPVAPTVKISNTDNGINVTWNAVSGATSYTVYRKTYNASTEKWGSWETLKTGYTSTAFLDKTVTLGVKYKYTAKAVTSSGSSSVVETADLQYDVAPTVKATNTNSGVNVTWNKINSATSYNVYRSAYDSSSGEWSKWASLKKGVTATSYNDTLGNLGVTYKYTVRAVLGDFAGKFVDSNSIKCAPVPKTTIANTASGVKVSWTNVFGATSYKVFRRELNTTNNTWSAWSSPASGVTGNAYVDKTVKLGTTYSYAVVAVNSSASSSFTASNSLKCDLTTTVTATNTNSGMKLTWNKVNGATGYTIYRKALNATNNTWSSWSVLKTGYTGTSYTDTLGNLGVSYIYCVRATVGSFSGSYVQSEAVQSNIAPKVTVKNASNGIQVSWNGILGSDSYTVYRRVYNASTQKWGSWTTLVKGNKSTGYVDTLGNLGATYSYTVRAVKGDFASSYVASVSIDCTPIVKASISNTSTGVKITWNNVFGATSYKVFRRELNTTNNTWSGWTSVTSGITGSAYTDKTAKLGATYSYAVVAVNGSASSNYVATSGLKCDIPVTVKATSTTSGINLSWNKVNGATGYIIYRKAFNATNNTWSSWSVLKTGYTGTSYNDTIGNLGVSYIYCVRATVGSYSGSYVQSAQVKCNISPKTTIANTTNGIKISWSNVFGATSYKIFRRELNTTNNTWGSWSVIASGVTGSACIDKTAKLGVTYSYAVVAVNSTVSSSYIASPGLKCDITTTVTATSTSSGINLKWNAVNGATGYTIYRKALNSTNNTWSAWSVLKTGYTSTSYNDTLGNLGVSYIYCVRATVGNYSGSYVQSAQVKCNIAPKTTATNTTDGIKVTWGNVFGATSYKVFRREFNTTNNTWSAWSSHASGLTGSAYVDKTAIFGATYTYAVVAVNNTASSGYIATPAIQCGTVPKVTIGVASNGIRVNWNAISGAESYVVYKKIYNPITETWSAWTTVTQNYKGTTVVDTDVNKDTYYVYTVRASKGNFNGSFAQSNVVKYTK